MAPALTPQTVAVMAFPAALVTVVLAPVAVQSTAKVATPGICEQGRRCPSRERQHEAPAEAAAPCR